MTPWFINRKGFSVRIMIKATWPPFGDGHCEIEIDSFHNLSHAIAIPSSTNIVDGIIKK